MINFSDAIVFILMFIPILSFHEAAHAWAADLLGDPTPRDDGRLTLNPLSHIDPIGTVFMPLLALLSGVPLIGWGKPVIIDAAYFRNWRRDDTLVALAGPFSNIVLAAIALFICSWLPDGNSYRHLGTQFAFVSVYLAVFNLIPIPPLDGWHPFKHLFRIKEEIVERGGLWWYLLLLVVVSLPPVRFAMGAVTSVIMAVLGRLTGFGYLF